MSYFSWLVDVEDLAESTAYLYSKKIELMERTCGDLSKRSSIQIKDFIKDTQSSVYDYNNWVSAIKKYDKYKDLELSKDVKIKAKPRELPKPLSEEDIDKILSVIPSTLEGMRDRAIIEILYCGLRNNECCSVTLQDFNNKELTVFGKGERVRIVPLTDPAWEAALKYALVAHGSAEMLAVAAHLGKEAGFVLLKEQFPGMPMFLSNENLPIYPRAIRRIVEKHGKAAGVVGAHPHRFRHSAATHLLDEGLEDLLALRNMLGHSSLETTKMYVEVSNKSRNKVIKYHPRNRK